MTPVGPGDVRPGTREAPEIAGLAVAGLPLLLALILLAAGCLGVRPAVGPVPARVDSLEGYASWRLERPDSSARSRFSFLLVPPGRGLIEVTDPLNRTVSRLFLEGDSAWLVVPGKRAYWQAGRAEVTEKLLGFDISVGELAGFLSGGPAEMPGWTLARDERSRVTGGRRGELELKVRRFFDNGRLPQTIDLSNGVDRGALRVIRLGFNQPVRPGVFEPAFLSDERYRAVAWADIEAWLRHED